MTVRKISSLFEENAAAKTLSLFEDETRLPDNGFVYICKCDIEIENQNICTLQSSPSCLAYSWGNLARAIIRNKK